MERDYSGWFVKYRLDLDTLTTAFPEIMVWSRSYFDPPDSNFYELVPLCLVRGETDEDSYLVLLIPGKALRYNLNDMTYKKLCDVEGIDIEGFPGFMYASAYQYIETLSCV
ncbi:hypothetical protein L1049_019645 [Liquidambar formosana]|uniref:Uncharacterized protein n=1 Tax=Liquidambar formosana TaxID=63359 RepID=A0AAP0S6D9_LIQFO